jgi:ribosomal protein S18 acetylase RimI-like enzyme
MTGQTNEAFQHRMSPMDIQAVRTEGDLKRFISLPYTLYRHDPIWIPPLRDEQHGQFDPGRNPLLEHCDRELFLLLDAGKPVGRISAFVDRLAVDFWRAPVGLFGYFECSAGVPGALQLLDAARDWLRARGMRTMRGPWTFVSQEWGMVVEGFEPPPVVMAPYNPPVYNEYLEAFGLRKVKDLLCWVISAAEGYQIPRRILELTDAVAARYGIRVRAMDMRRFEQEVKLIEQLSNSTIIDNWGYSPVTEAEVRATARDLKPVIQPKAVLFAEDRNGRPIGFAIAIPDVNYLLNGLGGSLLPFGWLKLLIGMPRLRRYRMYALGVIPEYQGKAVDSLVYRALYESLYSHDLWMEVNYVLEDNYPMINAIKKLGARPLRRYRVYEMEIA